MKTKVGRRTEGISHRVLDIVLREKLAYWGTKTASSRAAMKNAFPNHEQASPDASLSPSIDTPRLPRETIPSAPEAENDLAEHVEQSGLRSFALPLCLGLLTLLGAVSIGAWSARRSSQPPLVGPIANRVLVVKPVVVHVAGEVKKPGVYTLKNGARIFDALQKAGGAAPNADVNALNLAAPAQDGTKIEVPAKPQTPMQLAQKPVVVEDLKNLTKKPSDVEPQVLETPTPKIEAELPFASASAAAKLPLKRNEKTATSSTRIEVTVEKMRKKPTVKKPRVRKEKSKTIAGLPRAVTPSGALSNNASTEFLAKNPLDLNRITQEQLEALPGVGPSLAGRVLEYRKQNGDFKSVDELDDVKGIGEKKLEDLRPLLRVEGEADANQEKPQAMLTE